MHRVNQEVAQQDADLMKKTANNPQQLKKQLTNANSAQQARLNQLNQ